MLPMDSVVFMQKKAALWLDLRNLKYIKGEPDIVTVSRVLLLFILFLQSEENLCVSRHICKQDG